MADKKYNFMNTFFCDTDSFGNWSEEHVPLGLVDYNTERGEKSYYTYDEVRDLIAQGLVDTSNFCIKEGEERIDLMSSYCSSCTCFSIVNGLVLSKISDQDKAIVDYAKKIGLIHNDFVPVEGIMGIKEAKQYDEESYTISYKLKEDKVKNISNFEFLEKICIGTIKRLAGKRVTHYSKDKVEQQRKFECKDVYYDKSNNTLVVVGVKPGYMDNLTAGIKSLDLELFMIFGGEKHWSRYFDAAVMAVRDCGQHHWLKDLAGVCVGFKYPKSQQQGNYDWHDKKLGEEWD